MNLLLWVFQALLALLYLTGGYYKAFQFDALADQFPAVPRGGWRLVGLVEMVGAVLLIVPAAIGWMPSLTIIAAVVLAVETLVISGIYARHSLKMTPANPLVWSGVMFALVSFVAYARFAVEQFSSV